MEPLGTLKNPSPFGLWESRDYLTIGSQLVNPVRLKDVEQPSQNVAIKDVIDHNKKYEVLPDYPAHHNLTENTLFFDGRIEGIENYDL